MFHQEELKSNITEVKEFLQAYQAGERNFTGINLSNANLDRANLSGANLSGANLSHANLQGANLTKTKLKRTNLSHSNLQQANFSEAEFDRTNLSWCNLNKQNFKQASLIKVDLQGADLSDSDLTQADLTEAKLDAANLTGAILTNAILNNVYLVYARLQNTNLVTAELRNADLTGTDLSHANLDRANLSKARLRRANLFQASLQQAYLNDCNLQLANFALANLQQANLNNAKCGKANLQQANLKGVATYLAQNINLELAITGEIKQAYQHSLHLEIDTRGSFSFCQDNQTLAYAHQDDSVRLINISNGEPISQFKLPKFDPTVSVVFDSSGKTLYYSYYVNDFSVWNTKKGEIITKLKNHSANITAMVLNSRGEIISKTGTGKVNTTFDVGHETRTFFGYSSDIQTMAHSPCGKYTARSNPIKREVELINRETKKIIHTFAKYKKPVQSLAFTPDSRLLATYGAEDKRIYQVEARISTYESDNSPKNSHFPTIIFVKSDNFKDPVLITHRCFLATGYQNATSSRKENIQYSWNGSGGSRAREGFITYSANGRIAAKRYGVQPVQIWDVSREKEIATLNIGKQLSRLLKLNYSGDLLAVVNNCDISLWDIKNNNLVHQLKEHSDYINSITFSPDGAILISAGGDCTIKLWDTKTGKLITSFQEYSAIISLAFHPFKPILASGSKDGIITLWNIKTFQEIYRYTTYQKSKNKNLVEYHNIDFLQFSHDGNYLASKSSKLCLWTFKELANKSN